MRLFNFISVKLTICLIAGILLGYYLQPTINWIGLILIIAFTILIVLRFKVKKNYHHLFGAWAFGTTLLLGVFIISFSIPKNHLKHFSKFQGEPREIHLKVSEVLKPNPYSHRYIANVKKVSNEYVTGRVIIYCNYDSLSRRLSVDTEIMVYGKIDSLRSALNPYQFDYKSYLEKQQVHGRIYLNQGQWVTIENPTQTIVGLAQNFRSDLIGKLQKLNFGEEELGVIQALLLGQRNDISEEVYSDYKNAGAVHILAVSGLHIGILLLLLQFVLRPLERLPKGKTIKLILIVALLWVYAFIAGLSPSIVRAVTMFSFLAYALYLNRPTNTFNVLALSLFFILLVQPLFLFQVGFQMSYAAVFAIIWLYPKLQAFWQPKFWLSKKVWQLLSVSIAAQIGVLPLSLYYFHQFPALFFVSNLVVVPFLGIILGLGILVLFLTYLGIAPSFLVQVYNAIIKWMNTVIRWVAQQESFLFQDIPFDGVQMALGYLLIIAIIFSVTQKSFKTIVFALSVTMLFSGYLAITTWRVSKQERLILLHQTKNSLLLYQKGDGLRVMSKNARFNQTPIKNYSLGERIMTIKSDSLLNAYNFKGKELLIIDSTRVYPKKQVDYVLLTQSPKIHLERLLDSVQPKLLLIDGTNYTSYVNRWKTNCQKRKLPFHYTGEKGAYEFKLNN